MDCSPPGSSVHGSFQARVLEWGAIAFSVSCAQVFINQWTISCQSPLSSKEYWRWQPIPSSGDLPNPGIKPRSLALQADSLPSEPPWKSYIQFDWCNIPLFSLLYLLFSSVFSYPMDRGSWRTSAHGVAECHTCLRRFSMHTRCRHRCTGEKIGSERCNRQCVTWQRQGKLSSKSRTTWQRPGVLIVLFWSPALTPGNCSKRVTLETKAKIRNIWAPESHPHLLVKSPPAIVSLWWWGTAPLLVCFGVLWFTSTPHPKSSLT